MKNLMIKLIIALSLKLCFTNVTISQPLRQYTKSFVNGEVKWTFNQQHLSAFDEEEIKPNISAQQNPFHQKLNLSPNNLFDDNWTLQHPYPTDAWLVDVEAKNGIVISAGVDLNAINYLHSHLIKSTDRGENWSIQRFEADTVLYSIDMQANWIWLGGGEYFSNNGFVLKSSDLGTSWTTKLSIDSFAVVNITFFDENIGVVVSENQILGPTRQKIFHTTDGGNSWSENASILFGRTGGLHRTYFVNDSLGWKCLNDGIPNNSLIHTKDGGSNWITQFEDDSESFETIHFSDINNGWAAGVWKDYPSNSSEVRIYHTSNGGEGWYQQFLIENDYNAAIGVGVNISSIDSLNCWMAVSNNWTNLKVFRTINGGLNWEEISQLQIIDFQIGDIEFISATEGWITSALGMIHYTSDGGYSWEPKHKSVTVSDLESVDFIDIQTGWAVGKSSVFNCELIKTENGGDDWSVIYTDTVYEFVDIDFLSEQLGFGISGEGLNYSLINKTQDGGINWDTLRIVNSDLRSIEFTDNNNGWAVGRVGTQGLFITHTSNSGISWVQQPNINISGWGLSDVDFVNSEYGFAVGDFGALIKTTDGGNSWNESWGNLDPNLFWANVQLTGVFFPDLLNCWVTGYYGGYGNIVAHTTDGGVNWDTTSIPLSYLSNDILFINESDGYIVGQGYDYKTTDGGETWMKTDYPSDIIDMFFLNEALGWAVGYNGRIFKYYDPNVGVEEEINLQLPDNYVLMQNYPNPFNPSTTIKFSLPSSGYTTLKIYNALGEETAEMFDKEFPAGTYEVEWDATSLSSGVYFYQLKTESFVETKKMLLLK